MYIIYLIKLKIQLHSPDLFIYVYVYMHICVYIGVYFISTRTNLGCFLFPVPDNSTQCCSKCPDMRISLIELPGSGEACFCPSAYPLPPLPEHCPSLLESFLPRRDCGGMILSTPCSAESSHNPLVPDGRPLTAPWKWAFSA